MHDAVPEIPSTRAAFDIPRAVTYLNCAYMSPLSRAVIAAGEAGVRAKGAPWSIQSAHFFGDSELARGRFAQLLGCEEDCVSLAPAASYGIAIAANNLPVARGQTILVLAEQFPSNVYPWRALAQRSGAELITVPRPTDDDWTSAVLEAIDGRTAVAALSHCHWTDGGLLDLVAIGEALRAQGAALVVDATQSLGAMPFPLPEVQPDFLIVASYKWLMGPYSQAFVYIAPKHFSGTPLEHNWIAREGAHDFTSLTDYRDALQPGARAFDVGERSNFVLMPMIAQALSEVLAADVMATYRALTARNAWLARQAEALGARCVPDDRRAGHYLGLRFAPGVARQLLERLRHEQVHVSVRGDSLRVTPHLYNDAEDVERFLRVLSRSLRAIGAA